MTYLGESTDGTSMEHAVTQGLHDAMADTVKLAVLGSALALAILVISGPTGISRLLKRLTGA